MELVIDWFSFLIGFFSFFIVIGALTTSYFMVMFMVILWNNLGKDEK